MFLTSHKSIYKVVMYSLEAFSEVKWNVTWNKKSRSLSVC